MPDHITIRAEQPHDAIGIERVLRAAFPSDAEARLVTALRDAGRLTMSLVAVLAGEVVGHIAFSPVTVAGQPCGLGLAPLAVRPDRQRQGMGRRLVEAGLHACRELGVGGVVVLGDPDYYGRFGFQPAAEWQLSDEYGGGEAFQALELRPGQFRAGGGLVQYAPEFGIFAADAPNDSHP